MANKHRKPGDWKNIAAQRSRVEKHERTGRGLSNVPKMNETGSAAYRRMMAKRTNGYER